MTTTIRFIAELIRATLWFALLGFPLWLGCAASVQWNIAQQSTTTGTVEAELEPQPIPQPGS